MKQRSAGVILSGLFALLALGCGHHAAKPRGGLEEKLPRMEVAHPTHTILPRKIELSATVEPMEKAELCARVPGVVDYLPNDVDIGRRIRGPKNGQPGEKLVELAVPDLQAQKRHREALLDQAKKQKILVEETQKVTAREVVEAESMERRWAAEHAFLKIQYDRVKALVARDAQTPEREQEVKRQLEAAVAAWDAAKAQIETRKAKLKATEADLDVAESKIQVAEAELNTTKEMIKLATITAPFDGIITRRSVDHGATIRDPGTPLLTVMRDDKVRILLDIPERDVPLVTASEDPRHPGLRGDMVSLQIPALAGAVPNGIFEGHVVRFAGALDPNTRTMRTEVHLDNGHGHLRPGMYGIATVVLEEKYGAMTIPATALVRRGNKVVVYVVADPEGDPPTGVVKKIENLEIGLDDGQRVEIKRGLTEKDLVIVRGTGVIQSGDRVIAVRAKE